MTVQVSTSTQPYTGNGITTVFPIPFKWLDDSHIVGTSTVGVAVTPLVQGIDYTLAGGDTEGGGEATFAVAPASGTLIQFTRIVPITQLLNLIANDGFPAETVEQSLDKITMILQQHQDIMSGAVGAPTLGLTDAVSLGSGADVYKQVVAGVAQFRSLIAGSNVIVSENADDITISALSGGGGEVNTASNVGVGTGHVFRGKVALDLQFRTLIAGANITLTEGANEITIAGPASSGEVNTASNLASSGSSVFSSKVGVDLQFRRILAGANITVTQNANDITIAGASASGEANTASNIGVTGAGLFSAKLGVDLRFKGLAVGAGMAQSITATDVTHLVDQAFSPTWTGIHNFRGPTAASVAGDDPTVYTGRFSRTAPAGGSGLETTLLITGTTNATSTTSQWVNWVRLQNLTNDAGAVPGVADHVAQYVQAYKKGTGQTWAQVVEVRDTTSDYSKALYAIELDLCSNGLDPNLNRFGIAIYYGAQTNTFGAGAATMQRAGILINPFVVGRNALKYGLEIGGTVEAGVAIGADGGSAFLAAGAYSTAALNIVTTASPIGINFNPGSRMKFNSGVGNPPPGGGASNKTWWPNAFVPAYVGAIEVMVDGTALYIPVCSNHG